MRISVKDITQLLHKQIKDVAKYTVLEKGLNAAPGAASGKVILDTLEAVAEAKKGTPVILVRAETSPDDFEKS
jgi:pyruvate, orthophosphate dikinase